MPVFKSNVVIKGYYETNREYSLDMELELLKAINC